MADPKIWLLYRVSHQYGGALEGSTRDVETLLDADTDVITLARRANAHMAQPEQLRYERGHLMQIPAFSTRSNTVQGGGGGCFYSAHLEIRQAPRIKT